MELNQRLQKDKREAKEQKKMGPFVELLRGIQKRYSELAVEEKSLKESLWNCLRESRPDYNRLDIHFRAAELFGELNLILKWSLKTSQIVKIASMSSSPRMLYITKPHG